MANTHHILDTPIEYLKGVGPVKAGLLKNELKIFTFGDLLEHYPFRYVDKTKLYQIGDINPDTPQVQLKGRIVHIEMYGEARKRRLQAMLKDDSGTIDLVWFRGISYMQKYLKKGKEYLVFGKPNLFRNRFSLNHPEMEMVEEEQSISFSSRMEAVYSTTEKLRSRHLDSRGIHRLIKTLLEKVNLKAVIAENIPESVRTDYQLIDRATAFKNIHLPESEVLIKQAQRRLKFEEFFFIQMRIYQIKYNRNAKLKGYLFPSLGKYFNTFFHEKLPFELTGAQKRVLKEIRRDTLSGRQMNRLLQGDVGSGKTIVALMTMLMAMDSKFQACIMAPTEILAQQHYEGINELVEDLDIRVAILTGSVKGRTRRLLLERLEMGLIHILVGTHALIEDTVKFDNLGMVIIDEQHRFGVAQRAKLWAKNDLPPHVLVMTATPIPRTLAMTVYGDLDVSVIDELPPGRKPIKTVHYFDSKRLRVFQFMKEEIEKGRQIYIVYPLINESEAFNYKDLMDGYESIQRAFPLPDYRISVVHGQMHTIDKDEEMERFKRGETHIMVATTVIEVGVNVPNASVMIIESAERFGLAQLHQLRGRVGRGKNQSYCILMTGNKLTKDGKLRMKTMVETTDGFKIAEVDMKLRGPGDLEGTQQSGILNMKLADVIKDQKLLAVARQAAGALMKEDTQLIQPENQIVKNYMSIQQKEGRGKWSRIS